MRINLILLLFNDDLLTILNFCLFAYYSCLGICNIFHLFHSSHMAPVRVELSGMAPEKNTHGVSEGHEFIYLLL